MYGHQTGIVKMRRAYFHMEVSKMPESELPWYRRAWVGVVAVVLAILGTLLAVVGKGQFAKKKVADAQAEKNKTLEARLSDKKDVANTKLDTINAEADKAQGDAANAHEARSRAIADKALADANATADLSTGLLDSLASADRKLQR
jgi:cytoskeletal protein RodZ